MELRHLRYFVMAAGELNVSRASARLHVSQPAVSRQLHDLEDELGVRLFERQASGLKLTPAGDLFLAHARDVLRRSTEAVRQLQAFKKRSVARVAVGYIPPVLVTILTPALRVFARKHPDVDLELFEMSPSDQSEALRLGKIDLAFVGNVCPELEGKFRVVTLQSILFEAILPDDHRLASRKNIRLADLRDETFIGFSGKHFPGRNESICAACQQAAFTPKIRHRAESLSGLLTLVAAGKGVTLAPSEVQHLPHPHVRFIPLKPPAPAVVSAVAQRRESGNDPLLLSLLECCREVVVAPTPRRRRKII